MDSIRVPKLTNPAKTITWTRQIFENSIDKDNDWDSFSFPYHETLVSSLSNSKESGKKTGEDTEPPSPPPSVVWFNIVHHLGSFFGLWVGRQMRSTGVLNWFHPWIVNRHHYFYRGGNGKMD